MSELPSHGTGWLESEALLDLVTLYDEWNEQDANTSPDFTLIQRRLRELFTLTELRKLELLTHVLAGLVGNELALRGTDSEYKHPSDPEH